MGNVIVFEKTKSVFDEQTLDKLLEAAYVLQEHGRELRELERSLELKRDQLEAQDRASATLVADPDPESEQDFTATLAEIVEIQHKIQVRNLGVDDSLALIAAQVVELCGAAGAGIGIVEGDNVRYRAAAGIRALAVGTEVSADKAICVPCLRTAQAFRCADVNPELMIDVNECRRRGIGSLIAVPVFHDGGVGAALEAYYSDPRGFREKDIHTCQLMAGLITEALAREAAPVVPEIAPVQPAAILEALEKLQPSLAALEQRSSLLAATPDHAPSCYKCGNRLVGDEQFCGQCGAARSSEGESLSTQSKVASLWYMQESQKKDSPLKARDEAEIDTHRPGAPQVSSMPADLEEEIAASLVMAHANNFESIPEVKEESEEKNPAAQSNETASGEPSVSADWSSALSARNFLEQLAGGKEKNALSRLWNTRRGDIYLAVAVILVLCVIRWGIWSKHWAPAPTQASAAAQHKTANNDPELSMFDRMLISLGLAEAPQPPPDNGNPSTQVWIDLHTGLYYCPGADLYGKTPQGKYATQRDAQLDHFESAVRKACD